MDINKKLYSLQEISKTLLSKILCVNPNTKYLILEPSIIRPLEKVCGVKWLKGNGIEKLFKLDSTIPNFDDTNAIFYMAYASTTTFQQILNQIRSSTQTKEIQVKNKFHIIFVPRVHYSFELELEQHGLLNDVIRLHSFHWLPINLDNSLLSLELPNIYQELYVYQNTVSLPTLSKILWQLFFIVGKPKFIVSVGQFANVIFKQLEELCDYRGETDKLDSDFGGLVIVDRNLDYPSALLTPGVYAALLAEVFRVSCGICEQKQENSEEKLDEKCNVLVPRPVLNIGMDSFRDTVYNDVKYRYFTEVTTVLSNLTKQLRSEQYESKDMALDEMKNYVRTKLQATKLRKKLISNHLSAAECIINVLGARYEHQSEIEENIIHNNDKSRNLNFLNQLLVTENNKLIALRLFCLLNMTQKLSESEIKHFWLRYLRNYGFQCGFAYFNLIRAGFIQETNTQANKLIKIPKFQTNNFYTNAKMMRQIPSGPKKSFQFPTCASYVFGGTYVPLVTQICSLLLNATPIDEVRSKLEPFGTFSCRNDRGYPLQSRTLLVYVIGGATYAEIAACNLLETLTGSKIVFLSDRIVTGNDLMEALLEQPNNCDK